MRNDPVIAAVREVRHRISESVDHDPYRLVAYYRQRQERREHPTHGQQTAEATSEVQERQRRPGGHEV